MMVFPRIRHFSSLLLLCCLAFSLHTAANPISWQQAQQNARAFLQQRGGKCIAMPSLHYVPTVSTTACYIFNIGENEGYIVAAGDDCVPAVLGYADTGAVDVTAVPDNMRWWLDEYDHQIQFMRERRYSNLRAHEKSPERPAISPLMTTQWNQTPPYNNACPLDTNGKRCVTGCVATAMAQVLYYHHARSVTQTTHEIPAYVTDRGVSVAAVPAGSFIDWDNMVDKYGRNVETTDEQDAAVANLMRYCGTAVQMQYTSGSSGAITSHVAPAMVAFFNYSSKTKAWSRDDCGLSDEEWETLIYNELSNSRPVVYSGWTKFNAGHAFVCDGYDGEGFYHFNWGWGGAGAYYRLSAIDSVDASLIHYNRYQEAIINAEPRSIMPSSDAGIRFADPVTRALCLQAADADDDGTLTMDEADAVTTMGPFDGATMSSFDEFSYFKGVTSLGFRMFYDCNNMESIILHDRVTSIGENAFNGCHSLKEISIPSSVASIGNHAFLGCSSMKRFYWNVRSCLPAVGGIVPSAVEWLTLGDSVEVVPSSFARSTGVKHLVIGKNVTKINSYAFYQCAGLKKVVIPDAVTSIAQWAFYENTGLEELSLGKSLTNIDNNAFGLCASLTRVSIPDAVTRIGMSAFKGCTRLRSIVIGKSVASINGSAFAGCDSLKVVTCLVKEPISIKDNVFNNLYDRAILRVPADAVEAYKAATPWNRFSQIIAIDLADGDVNLDGVTNINDVTDLIDQIMKNGSSEYSDIDGDGRVAVADVTALLNILLTGD